MKVEANKYQAETVAALWAELEQDAELMAWAHGHSLTGDCIESLATALVNEDVDQWLTEDGYVYPMADMRTCSECGHYDYYEQFRECEGCERLLCAGDYRGANPCDHLLDDLNHCPACQNCDCGHCEDCYCQEQDRRDYMGINHS